MFNLWRASCFPEFNCVHSHLEFENSVFHILHPCTVHPPKFTWSQGEKCPHSPGILFTLTAKSLSTYHFHVGLEESGQVLTK